MTTAQLAFLLCGLVVLTVLTAAGWRRWRRASLRRRFGPEYDRLVSERDTGHAARELRERERRRAALTLRELSPETSDWYAEEWLSLQARFVEAPSGAVGAADELVGRLIAERGYPRGDREEQLRMLSVDHPRALGDYRRAREIARRVREADTEELRQAMTWYRAMVTELLGRNLTTEASR